MEFELLTEKKLAETKPEVPEMEETRLDKLYEIVLSYKSELEKNRDEINKYYTSLFSAFLAIAPFLDKILSSTGLDKSCNIKYTVLVLSALGLVLAASWRLTLQRIHIYIKGIDELLVLLEKKLKISFITYMFNYLDKTNAPARVTKQEMLVPNTFIILLLGILLYSVSLLIL